MQARASSASRRGFSTLELLVVAGILVLLLGIAASAVSGVIYSSQRSLAENQLRVAMGAARDAAIRSNDADAAAVFYFREGRTIVIPCAKVGVLFEDTPRLFDNAASGGNQDGDREIFAPIDGANPIVMPRGWTVRGFARPGSISDPSAAPVPIDNGWYDWVDVASAGSGFAAEGMWVFPETDFLPRDARGIDDMTGKEGWRRQTFMIRFAAQTGEALLNDSRLVLVVDPADADFRFTAMPWTSPGFDLQQYASLETGVRRLLAQGSGLTLLEQRSLFGDESTDTILARPVVEFALTDERRLANAIGAAGLNRDTQSLYRVQTGTPGDAPPMDESLLTGPNFPSGFPQGDAMRLIRDYIGQVAGTSSGQLDPGTIFEARVFTMSRYLGQMQEVIAR